jgi:hypothetical protein
VRSLAMVLSGHSPLGLAAPAAGRFVSMP